MVQYLVKRKYAIDGLNTEALCAKLYEDLSLIHISMCIRDRFTTDDYEISNIRLKFDVTGDRVEYVFSCEAKFFIRMFGQSYPTITQRIELTGYHNTKF